MTISDPFQMKYGSKEEGEGSNVIRCYLLGRDIIIYCKTYDTCQITMVKAFQILCGNYLSALSVKSAITLQYHRCSSVTLCTNLRSDLPTLAQLYWAQIHTHSALASFS